MPVSAHARQRRWSILPRHSIPRMRTIIANRIANGGRYSVENTVAYQFGNAANMAAPAVISHTSLASQTGPMVFNTARRRRLGVVLLRPLHDIAAHQPQPDQRKHPVEQGEDRQRQHHHTGRMVGDPGMHRPAHRLVPRRVGRDDPWLAAQLTPAQVIPSGFRVDNAEIPVTLDVATYACAL